MNKGQISFAFAGLLFGFLVGFVVAHQIYAGRGEGFQHPPMPPGMTAAPPMGDRPGGGSPAPAAAPAPGGDTATMEQVQKEIKSLNDILAKNPNDVDALVRLGNMHFDAGMFDKAIDFYRKALTLRPGDVNVETDLGTALRNSGQPQEAMKHFERSVAADPSHWKGWFNIGIVAMYDLGDFDRAQKAFEKVNAINPGAIDMNALHQEMEKVRSQRRAGGGSS